MKTFLISILLCIITALGIAQNSLDSGLVAYFPFNGNAIDVTGNGYNGTINGNAALVPDRFGGQNNSFTFPDQSSNISLANTTSLNLQTGFTINAWIKYKNPYSVIVCKHACGIPNGFIFGIDFIGQIAVWVANASTWSSIHTNDIFNEDQWYMVTATYDGNTGTAKIYIDGEVKSSGNVTYNNFTTYPISIGEAYMNNCSASNMTGAVDELKIYDRPLTDAEIQTEYNLSDDGLIAFYPFAGNANDESGNGNDLINNGANLTTDRFGISNNAYQFSGSSNLSRVDSDLLDLINDFSVSFWINRPGSIQYTFVMSKHLAGDDFSGSWGIASYAGGNTLTFSGTPHWGSSSNPITGVISENTWHHIVFTYDKYTNEWKSFVDGFLSNNGTQAFNIQNTDKDFMIGACMPNVSNITASLDDIRIYNRVIDASEVLSLYNDSTTFNTTSVTNVYPHQNSSYFLPDETIKVFFNEVLDPTTINSSSVFVKGNLTGWYTIDPMYNSGNNSIEISPASPFKVGEEVTVSITNEILNSSGVMINPYVFSFKVKPYKGSAKFVAADSLQLTFPPTRVTSADLNNDGLIDVVACNYDSSKVQISLNNGNGTFLSSQLIDGLFKPMHCALSDIDNDGDVDMIIPTNEQNKIQIYKNDGAGLFTNYSEITINAVVAVCPGDFDGGGNTDFVAMTNFGLFDSRAHIFKNDGQGNFTESGYTTISFPVALRNIVGDIDNDGDLDIIGGTGDYWGVYKILLNDCNGNFTYTGGPYIGPNPDEIAGGDFDGDYDLDFVKADWYQSGIQLGLNDGSGTYNILNLGNVGGSPRNPEVNDFDGDGDLDNVNTNGNYIQILTNNGSLNFTLDNYPIGTLNGITAADFNNNGSMDLAGISATTNQIIFIKNCVDSLVAHWPFDGNIGDIGGNFNDGINNGGTFSHDRYGVPDRSIYFDGSTSYAEGMNPGNNLPAGDTPRTFSCWVKSSEASSSRNIFHYGTAQAAPTNYHLFMQDGKYVGIGNGYGFGFLQSSRNIGDETWHFITTVYEGSSTNLQSIYIDGRLDTSGVITSTPNTALLTNWKMGQFMGGSPSLLGNVDDLKIYNLVLSEEQIWANYKVSTTAPNLLFPGNDSTLINPTMIGLVLDWDSTLTATGYRLLLANDSLYNTVIHDTIVSTSSFNFYDWFSVNIDNLYWKVRTINDGGIGPWSETNRFNIILTDVEDEIKLPTEFALMQNYPNPLNPSTMISYQLPVSSNVTLIIYDVLGNEIATLVNDYKPAGIYNVQFTMNNLSSGIYFYQLKVVDPESGSGQVFVQTKKMILMK